MRPPHAVAIRVATAVAFLAIPVPPARAQSLATLTSAAIPEFATSREFQPAGGGLRYPAEWAFTWGDAEPDHALWAATYSGSALGLSARRIEGVEQRYGIGIAGGDAERLRFGWNSTLVMDEPGGDRAWDHSVGALARPRPWVSLGGTLRHLGQPRLAGERQVRDYDLGLALRPLALSRRVAHTLGPRLTLTADVAWREDARREAARPRVGAEIEPFAGVLLRGEVERGGFRVGLGLLGTRSGYHGSAAFARREDSDPARTSQSHTLSLHRAEDASVLAARADRRVAVVRIGGTLSDERLDGVSLLGGGGGETVVKPIHDVLERAARDPLTRGVLLDLRGTRNLAQVEELLPRIARVRAAGKPVVAFLEYGGQRADLLLAAACDRAVATEEAFFWQLGLRAERRSYRSLLERLGLRMERTSYGQYKSAYRQFSVDSTSDADAAAIDTLLDERQRLYVERLSAETGQPPERFAHILDGRPWRSRDLVAAGLLDSVGYRTDAVRQLGALAGFRGKPRLARLERAPEARREWRVPTRLAVVYASGGIELGRSGSELLDGAYMGSESVTRQLERAFSNPEVEAVVLRIESPGGSSLASDLIHHATLEFKRERRKPLIASMGGVAASGGYYIAMGADRIYADPSTVTGSIGVVSIKPSLEGMWTRLGVRQESWERGEFMGGWSIHRDWTERDQAIADSATLRYYRAFVGSAAADRGQAYEELEPNAQGRVWFGTQALERRLIDELGGLEDAVAEARRRAGIPDGEKIRVVEYRRPAPGILQRVVGNWVRTNVVPEVRVPQPGETRYEADVPLEP